ncbi:GPCR, family 3 [Corchorus olitorius]|uniref:GPCR, family 3 n=1 Tax=Corchorus olitorius TaxID=93759 RepID=A0A1R3J2P2_9ROSI|nr:GPCR, family 3 [Corchorus olitorius]
MLGIIGLSYINMAISDFYATHASYRIRLVLNPRDSKMDVVGAAAADLIKKVELQAIIGTINSMQANFVINLGNNSHVPIISFSTTSPALTSFRSPYFLRVTQNDSFQVHAISGIVQAFGWREVVLIYIDNEFGESIIPYLTDALQLINARVPYRSVIPSFASDDHITQELYKLMTMLTRVFIVHMPPSLGNRLFAIAKQIGMMSKGYAWIVTDGMTKLWRLTYHLTMDSFKGILGVITLAYDAAIALAMAIENVSMATFSFNNTNLIPGNGTDLEKFGVGFWTPKSGLVRELTDLGTNKPYLGQIIWPEDTISYPKGWEIPTNGKKLRIGVPVKKFIPFATPDGKSAGTYNDLIFQVFNGTYDVVVGDTTIVSNKSQYVDFTLPYTESGERLVSNLARFVVIIWCFVVLILTQSYTASLTSLLTVQQLQPTVTDIHEILKRGERIGFYANGGISAALDEIPYIKLFLAKYCGKYTTIEPTYETDGFRFVFPRGSPLVADVSRAILNVTQGEKNETN